MLPGVSAEVRELLDAKWTWFNEVEEVLHSKNMNGPNAENAGINAWIT